MGTSWKAVVMAGSRYTDPCLPNWHGSNGDEVLQIVGATGGGIDVHAYGLCPPESYQEVVSIPTNVIERNDRP